MKGEGTGRPKAIIDWHKLAAMLEAGWRRKASRPLLGLALILFIYGASIIKELFNETGKEASGQWAVGSRQQLLATACWSLATPPVSHWRRQDGGGGSAWISATRLLLPTAHCPLLTAHCRVAALVKSFRFKPSELGRFTDVGSVRRLFKPDIRLIGLTNGHFSLIDLIHGLLQEMGGGHVICCTWSAGIKDAPQVHWMVESKLIESFTIITDRSFFTRQNHYALSISQLVGQENIRVTDLHAKFVLLYNASYKVVLRTSMNLNANRTCENFELDVNDDEIYNFYHEFTSELMRDTPARWDLRRRDLVPILARIFAHEKQSKAADGLEQVNAWDAAPTYTW